MQWLLDSDVIWKLATFDLLNELIAVLEAQKSDFFCLPTLKFQLKSKGIWFKHDHDAIRRVMVFIKGTKEIIKIDKDEQNILKSAKSTYQGRLESIDIGEQLLFMGTKFLDLSIVSTHDKKALRTLANDPSCKQIHDRVKGRVLCLEQIVLRMIDKYGYKKIQAKIAPKCNIDEIMIDAFAGGKPDFPETECRKWLNGDIQKLNSETADILRPD